MVSRPLETLAHQVGEIVVIFDDKQPQLLSHETTGWQA
jgi:hypothetical protein